MQHQRSKHIDIKYHFVKSEIQKEFLHVAYVTSKDNVADTFTKLINKNKNICTIIIWKVKVVNVKGRNED